MQTATRKRTEPSLPAGVLLVLWFVFATIGSAAEPARASDGWRALLPEGWLVAAAARDAEQTEQAMVSLLDDLAYDYRGVVDQLKLAAGLGDVVLANRELVVGWSAAPTTDGDESTKPYAFALAPTDDFAGFVRACRGEMAGPVAVATMVGVDLCLAPCGGWVFVAEVEKIDVAQQVMNRAAVGSSNTRGLLLSETDRPDLLIEFSPSGVDHAWRRASSTDAKTRRRALAQGVPWPPTLAALDAALGQNAPLLDAWRQRLSGATLAATIRDNRLAIQLHAPLVDPAATASAAWEAPPRRLVSSRVVAEFNGSAGPLAKLLGPLYLGYAQGRPDEIDAHAYEEANYGDFASAVSSAMARVEAFRAVALPRGEGEPVLAGQAVLLRVDDNDAFFADAQRVASRWNALVSASRARMPILFETDAAPAGGGLALSVDMVKAFGVRPSREIEQLLRSLFGPDGRWHRSLLPVGRGLVLAADLPAAEAAAMAERLRTTAPAVEPAEASRGASWRGTLEVDLAAALLDTWRRVNRPDARGRGLAPLKRSPPMRFQAELTNGELRCEAVVDRETLRGIGESLRASRD